MCAYLQEVRTLIETRDSEMQTIIAGIRKLDAPRDETPDGPVF